MSEGYALSTTLKNTLQTILAYPTMNALSDESFDFLPKSKEFAVDNCATHHVCNDKSLFISDIKPVSDIGISGVGGTALPVGISTVAFNLKNSDGIDDYIKLENTIYLPQCPKNLISVTRWSSDRKDDCGIFSRGTYSIFLWNNDK